MGRRENDEQISVNVTKTLLYYYTHVQITTEYVFAKRQSGLPGTGKMEAIVSVQTDENNLMVS
jgi:hypothetical protein